jgi:hypothetical protein
MNATFTLMHGMKHIKYKTFLTRKSEKTKDRKNTAYKEPQKL